MNRSQTYKVTLNWYGEIHTFYTSSTTKRKALSNAMIQLAKELVRSNYSVRQYFNDGKDKYEVKWWKEVWRKK